MSIFNCSSTGGYLVSHEFYLCVAPLFKQLFCFATGPAGFYATQHLINHGGCDTTVDIYERLPVPFGLVSLKFCIL